jgi:hypothetical protein
MGLGRVELPTSRLSGDTAKAENPISRLIFNDILSDLHGLFGSIPAS